MRWYALKAVFVGLKKKHKFSQKCKNVIYENEYDFFFDFIQIDGTKLDEFDKIMNSENVRNDL